MSIIEITRPSVGSVTNATTTNTIYSTLAAATTSLDDANLRTEACTRAHFVASSVTSFTGQSSNATTTGTYTGTTAATHISHGTAMTVAVAQTIHEGDVVRMHANVYTTETVLDSSDTDAGQYSFKFYWDIGAGYVAADTAAFTYSISVRPVDIANESIYKNRRHGFSLCYIHSGANISLAGIKVYVQLTNAANSITIKQDILDVIIQRH